MNEETVKAWCARADSDLKIGRDELVTPDPATDAVCFHMQQCVEKYLKAFLVFHGREVPRTHNIALVLQRCIDIDSEFAQLQAAEADTLTPYAVEARYPDAFRMPSVAEARAALEIASRVKLFVLPRLLPPGDRARG